MTFVDTNVFMYAVGREHPLKPDARAFFERAISERRPLCTSAEVMQELLHAYLPVGRLDTLDAAMRLLDASVADVWPIERDDVVAARALSDRHPALGARDLLHLACCRRRRVGRAKTFDRALASCFAGDGSAG